MLLGVAGVLKERLSDAFPSIARFTVKPCYIYLSIKIWRSHMFFLCGSERASCDSFSCSMMRYW
jgi:hypothetical protein